jgi:AraC family L-rhamnose operon transcriptional activator RhaR/AraC family L-rhamnose operon regulatory protein RhaS
MDENGKTLLLRDFRKDDSPLQVLGVVDHPSYPIHRHDFTEIVVVFGGRGIHVLNEEEHSFRTGNIFVVDGTVSHGYRETDHLELVNIMFDPSRILLDLEDLRRIPGYHTLFRLEPEFRTSSSGHPLQLEIPSSIMPMTRDLVGVIQEELASQQAGARTVATGRFAELLVVLCRNVRQSGCSTVAPPFDQLGRVLGFLERNWNREVTAEDLSATSGMSRRNLQRRFREALGTTPVQHLLEIRMRRAEQLLTTTQMSVGEIASSVGFEDSNYFSRCFRSKRGVSPVHCRASWIARN